MWDSDGQSSHGDIFAFVVTFVVPGRSSRQGGQRRGRSAQAKEAVEELAKLRQDGSLLRCMTPSRLEAGHRREDLGDRRASWLDSPVSERCVDERAGRLGIEAFVGDDAVELIRAPRGDERSPGAIDLGSRRQRIDEGLDEVLLVFLRRDGLDETARSMAARISLSSPSPFASRYCSTSIRM